MRPSAEVDRRRTVMGRTLTASASLMALASAFWGLKIGVPRLDDTRHYWSAVAPELRNDPVAQLYGFGEPLWQRLRLAVGKGDRYAVVAEGEGQYDIRNYAAYSLLPAIQVKEPADADVVIYYDVPGPAGCVSIGSKVCLVRHER